MGLFFMSVGMSIDGKLVVARAGLLVLCALALLPLKAIAVRFRAFCGSPARGSRGALERQAR